MRLIPRLGSREPGTLTGRPTTTRLRLHALEDRSLPSFGFGSALAFGGTGSDFGIGVATDSSANVYVSGMYSGTVNFDPNNTNPTSNQTLTASGGYDNF